MAASHDTQVLRSEGAVGAQVQVRARRWQDAIAVACRPLVDQDAVLPRYVVACIASVVANGPYIVIAPGVALAHARPEDGAQRLGLAAATLAEAVPFGHPVNDPVDVVLAFASPDRDRHVGLLGALARALGKGLADRLRTAEEPAGAIAALNEVINDAS